MPASTFRFQGWSLFSLLAALVLLMTALTLALHPDLTEGVRSAIHATARSSFALFLLAFGLTCAAIAIRLVGKLAQANSRRKNSSPLGRAAAPLVATDSSN